jgi:hypothetical protein
MGLLDDPIQFDPRTSKVWRERDKGSSISANTAPCGHVGGDGSIPAEQRRKSKGTGFTIIPEKRDVGRSKDGYA